MRLASLREASSLRRRFFALGMMAAFLFAIALSDSPRLHEALHKSSGDHVCAVTLVSAGACDHLAGSTPAVAPGAFRWAPILFPSSLQSLARGLEFSRLEHAPPALS
ncbi:MAG: hypothetical protein M3429_01540 [Verrucomicrobiota bacterium]|nr:hypothetical protein [Chthoniobacterales bacterium]MDQ3545193.1 hypothetical protein [Verrucomicrobiota bacterium]